MREPSKVHLEQVKEDAERFTLRRIREWEEENPDAAAAVRVRQEAKPKKVEAKDEAPKKKPASKKK